MQCVTGKVKKYSVWLQDMPQLRLKNTVRATVRVKTGARGTRVKRRIFIVKPFMRWAFVEAVVGAVCKLERG